MTLGDFFEILSQNPSIVIFYFVALPLSALLGWIFGRGDGHLSPWKYFYCAIIYLACVPGIFGLTLSIYQFLFERLPIAELNIFTQVLPILSMFLTIWLVRKNVSLDQIPGFGKLPALMLIILILLALMWGLDKTRIIVFTGFPFFYVIFLMILLFVVIRLAIKRIAA